MITAAGCDCISLMSLDCGRCRALHRRERLGGHQRSCKLLVFCLLSTALTSKVSASPSVSGRRPGDSELNDLAASNRHSTSDLQEDGPPQCTANLDQGEAAHPAMSQAGSANAKFAHFAEHGVSRMFISLSWLRMLSSACNCY